MKIKQAIIPAAGLGTRFLPFTKSVPKEMLPLINKPAIQHIIEETGAAGIFDLSIIIGNGKQAIIDYFAPLNNETSLLKDKDKELLDKTLFDHIRDINLQYIKQPKPLGLGHAIMMAREVIEPESSCAILLPDDILIGQTAAIGEMAQIAEKEQAAVIAVQEVPPKKISSYGIAGIKKQINDTLFEVSNLVEKPKKEDAPSNYAIVGRYVLPHSIFDALDEIKNKATGEIQLTDAIQHLLNNGHKLIAYKFPHKRFDTGTPHGWLEAIIHCALNDHRYAADIKEFLKE